MCGTRASWSGARQSRMIDRQLVGHRVVEAELPPHHARTLRAAALRALGVLRREGVAATAEHLVGDDAERPDVSRTAGPDPGDADLARSTTPAGGSPPSRAAGGTACVPSSSPASPKSASRTDPSAISSTLAGLTSPWIHPASCTAASAATIWDSTS